MPGVADMPTCPCACACAPAPRRRFKHLADRKKGGVSDDDLLALMSDELHQPTQLWDLVDLQVCVRGGVFACVCFNVCMRAF